MKKAVVYGAGQVGVMVAETLLSQKGLKVVGFVDDAPDQAGLTHMGLPVLGNGSILQTLHSEGITDAVVCIGDREARARAAARVEEAALTLMSAIDPSATISESARIGRGTVVTAGVVICAHTVLGMDVCVMPGVIVSHDVVIGDHVLLGVGCVIGARVEIGDYAFVGASATIVPAHIGVERLRVGKGAVIGAGAVVLGDIPDHALAVGVPARVVR